MGYSIFRETNLGDLWRSKIKVTVDDMMSHMMCLSLIYDSRHDDLKLCRGTALSCPKTSL